MMKKYLFCTIICTLLITVTALPVMGGTDAKKETAPILSVIDQQQTNTAEIHWLDYAAANWQQFVNYGDVLEKVEVHIGCYFLGSTDITLSIEKVIGTPLTSVTYPANALPLDNQDWFTFDVPDVNLLYGETYHMVIRFGIGSEYAWSGAFGDPYPPGLSSRSPQWDYAFKTIVNRIVTINLNGEIRCGFGVNIWLKNIDEENPMEIPIDLNIVIDAPIMLLGTHSTLPIPLPIPRGGEVTVSTGFIFGFGKATVMVEADLFSDGVIDKTVTADGFILFPFALIGITPINLP